MSVTFPSSQSVKVLACRPSSTLVFFIPLQQFFTLSLFLSISITLAKQVLSVNMIRIMLKVHNSNWSSDSYVCSIPYIVSLLKSWL